ncbi:Ankyrin_repeat-containing domain superfamily [Hexamita inflata]|uniref:Ankyrin repeat-containing domain superfamily n=1 Tax=Hexamita inflata TaxID=28002 RepID=A0AA86PW16_9EUKA|nr:Ankyrin repeat-containing domain superfamily [Hexamita inflata]
MKAAQLTPDEYFDAIIDGNLTVVKSAPNKYHKLSDTRESTHSIISNMPPVFYSIYYFKDDVLNYLLTQRSPVFNSDHFSAPVPNVPNPIDVFPQTSALIFALCCNNEFATKQLLKKHPELILKRSSAGTTPLEAAVRFNQKSGAFIWQSNEVVKTLITKQNKCILNPLQTACLYGRNTILRFWYKMIIEFEDVKPNFYKAALMLNDNYNNIVELAEEAIDLEECNTSEDAKFDAIDIAQIIMQDAINYAEAYKDFDPELKRLLEYLTNTVEAPALPGQLLIVTDTAYEDEEYEKMKLQHQKEREERKLRGEDSDDLV